MWDLTPELILANDRGCKSNETITYKIGPTNNVNSHNFGMAMTLQRMVKNETYSQCGLLNVVLVRMTS